MAIIWTKDWAASDDGTVLKAVDLKNIQDDINTTGLADADSIQGVPVDAPVPGDDGKALVYDDATPSFTYLDISGLPSGIYLPYGGTTAPTGWQLCAGTAVSRATFADLFTAIGVKYGVGDGATTFNLPDMRGRNATGLDNMGGVSADVITDAAADSEAGTAGQEEHTLTVDEIPAHSHEIAAKNAGSLGSADYFVKSDTTTNSHPGDTETTGGGMAHTNLQPSLFSNWIIKN